MFTVSEDVCFFFKIEDVRSDSEEDEDELSEGEDYKGIPNNVKDNSPRARPKFRGDKGYQ